MLTLFSTGVAAASSRPSDDVLAAITARGVLLAGYDAAAWQSTDAVTASHPSEGLIERYIARKTDAGWVVDFGRLGPFSGTGPFRGRPFSGTDGPFRGRTEYTLYATLIVAILIARS
jgi:hypothetical protein